MSATVTTPIRRMLITSLVLVVVLLGGAIWMAIAWGERQLAERWCTQAIRLQLDLAEQRLDAFFDEVRRDLELLRQLGEHGQLKVDDPASLEVLFATLLRESPQATDVQLADGRGHAFSLSQRGEQWTSRQTRLDEWADEAVVREWTDGSPRRKEYRQRSSDDPRQRPWYVNALARGREREENAVEFAPMKHVQWTLRYRSASANVPSLTVSSWFRDTSGRDCVVAFDILLADLIDFTQSVRVGAHGTLFFLDEQARPIDVAADDVAHRSDAGEDVPSSQTGVVPPQVAAAMKILTAETVPKTRVRRFRAVDQWWWVDAKRFRLSDDSQWWAVVVVPEQDVVGGLSAIRSSVAGVTLLAIVLAAVWAVRFARGISQPIETLVHRNEEIAAGHLNVAMDLDSPITEIQHLATAQQKMQSALQSLFKLERELQAARAIQQSTFPQRFPTVAGFEIAGWSEPAEETGGDTYDVVEVVDADPNLPRSQSSDRQIIYLLLADTCGHGVGPALCAVQLHALFHIAVTSRDGAGSIARLINQKLHGDLPPDWFITAWIGRLNPRDKTITTYSAGQGPILWFRAAEDRVEWIREPEGLPFGLVEEADASAEKRWQFASGDVLAVLSDGIFEAANRQQDLFGDQRVAEVLRRSANMSAGDILAAIRGSLEAFVAGCPAADDQTALIIKCVGE
jgi:sigma-B regulation protein RsbU (phosphoserine phosphatase)